MSLSGSGKLGEATTANGCGGGDDGGTCSSSRHPPWYAPIPATGDPIAEGKLLIHNTLTGKKEPFVPMNGRSIRWYTCGPTVYDSSHLGHARTYLSFDIMRRIFSDYFHYNVLFQVNTTDIDDKIILRARQNVLVKRLEDDDTVTYEALVDLAKTAFVEAKQKAEEKKEKMVKALAEAKEAKNSRAEKEQEELLKQHKKKQQNLDDEKSKFDGVIQNGNNDRAELIAAAKSVLAEKLDREKGDTVTEHSVFNNHARQYEREFMEDMRSLNIRDPDVLTRVTEYIPQIKDFVQSLIQKDMAYESNGSVYLSLDSFKNKGHNYRKLSPAAKEEETSAAELAESEGALASTEASEKRNKNDFALWKASKAGEPAWESPWGPGRPGWHIECSVVAGDILGETLDIHSGGDDLKFPHHDNELAQSEACFGCNQWVNYFTHTGHLSIAGLKMSKSLKNFITIRQALENNTARQLRIVFLLQGWDQPMNYSDQTIEEARDKEKTFNSFFREVEVLSRNDYLADEVGWRMGESDRKLSDEFLKAQQKVHESLLDNFNTKDAMHALFRIINEANIYLKQPNVKPAVLLLRGIAIYVTQILKVFGVVTGSDEFGFGTNAASGAAASSTEAVAKPYIETLVSFREKVREVAVQAAKGGDAAAAIKSILNSCDELRDEVLPTVGVRLEDRQGGTFWSTESPEVLMKEIAEKKAREKEENISRLEKKLVAKEKELQKINDSMVKPDDMFRTDEFKEWDESGLPITLADGSEVSKGQKKKHTKAMNNQTKAYKAIHDKSDNNPQKLVDVAQSEIDDIKAQLSKLSL